jgi:hypothetical protein
VLEINREIAAILDLLCRQIELPPQKVASAKSRYKTIGDVLIGEESSLSGFSPRVYAQGSISLGTTNRPLETYEFDVDLACAFALRPSNDPDEVRRALFNQLANHPEYKGRVYLKARCVQVAFVDEFHMDVMPCIPTTGKNVQVPDRQAGGWVLSDPEGYAADFHEAAKKLPRRLTVPLTADDNRMVLAEKMGTVEPFPALDGLTKMPLQRCVQLLKRHRDKIFYEDNSTAPSSIIITTLARRSYAKQVDQSAYDCPIELLIDMVRGMPEFIQTRRLGDGRLDYTIGNPVLPAENFASKWKDDSRLPSDFYSWQRSALRSLEELAKMAGAGLPQVGRILASDYGHDAASQAIRQFSATIQENSKKGKLDILRENSRGEPQVYCVPRHTNFGA